MQATIRRCNLIEFRAILLAVRRGERERNSATNKCKKFKIPTSDNAHCLCVTCMWRRHSELGQSRERRLSLYETGGLPTMMTLIDQPNDRQAIIQLRHGPHKVQWKRSQIRVKFVSFSARLASMNDDDDASSSLYRQMFDWPNDETYNELDLGKINGNTEVIARHQNERPALIHLDDLRLEADECNDHKLELIFCCRR